MKYRIPGTYHSDTENSIVDAWVNHIDTDDIGSRLDFASWLKKYTKASTVTGNFEDGWTVEFDDEARYTWFVMKWSTS
jgi:hypothetical protein